MLVATRARLRPRLLGTPSPVHMFNAVYLKYRSGCTLVSFAGQ